MRTALCALVLVMAAWVAADAVAQGTDLAASGGRSFADQFFVSRKIDPSGGKSVELLGSAIIWFLMGLSVVSIGLIGNQVMANRRQAILPPSVVDDTRRLLEGADYKGVIDLAGRDDSFFARILRAALHEANHGYPAVIRALEQSAEEYSALRLRRLEYLNVVGQVSPMIGLFGTVYGMILAFQAIVVAGGNADPVLLAGGIGTALTTTFWGLIVAIPALAGYGVIRNKIDELTAEATLQAEEMLQQFRPRTGKPASGGAAGKER